MNSSPIEALDQPEATRKSQPAHPRCHLGNQFPGGDRRQQVPARRFQIDCMEHRFLPTHTQLSQTQTAFQTTVRRFNPGSSRVSFSKCCGVFFPTAFRQSSLVVSVVQRCSSTRFCLDWTRLAEWARVTCSDWNLDRRRTCFSTIPFIEARPGGRPR